MITVNKNEIDHEEGTTVALLLKRLDFIFPMLVVRINGAVIDRSEYDRTLIKDRDNIEVIHMISGG
ncbi:MAG: sulfur carrier protein ThiS [Proteobacteria bacterium]|nr:sulfur carrier protein ThiS [Pseudomonadota bacterium]